MKNYYYFLLSILLINCNTKNEKKPPILPEKEKTYQYFGQEIKDPYHHVENLEDTIIQQWFKNQTIYTSSRLNKINGRKNIIDQQNQLDAQTAIGISNVRTTPNDLYFYLKRDPNEDVAKLYYRKGFNGEEILLLNPASINSDNPPTINYTKPNYNGSKIAVSLTKDDAEIGEMIIIDVVTQKPHKEIITNCWPSALAGITWLSDNNSFIYSHIPVIDKNSEEYLLNTASVLYTIGSDPKKHTVILSKKNNPKVSITSEDFPIATIKNNNDNYLFGRIGGARNFDDYYYAEYVSINTGKINWKLLYKKEDKINRFYVKGNDIIFLTAKDAPNFKICKTSLSNPDFQNPNILVEEDKNAVITDFVLTSEGVFYVKTKNGVEAKLYQVKDGKNNEISIPKPSGKITLYSHGAKHRKLRINIRGWTHRLERYQYDFDKATFVERNLYPIINYPELQDVEVKEIEIPSHDGTMVPLSIIHKKGIKRNANNPVFITGYGAYGISETPFVDTYMLHWVNKGGIYAIAHVRGGGEKGDSWHKGGYKTSKPNSWKDFIACTEYLINQKYTSPNKIAVWSGSAGGILIGRAITERPDLYAAAIIKVGILNTLRYEFAPNGANNTKEFGTVKDSIEYKALYEMDAYHHIQEGVNYPAVYLTAGINDARVPVWQPAKFAARLQAANASKKPILFSIDFEGGHGFDASPNKQNEELADILSFAFWQTGHPDYQP